MVASSIYGSVWMVEAEPKNNCPPFHISSPFCKIDRVIFWNQNSKSLLSVVRFSELFGSNLKNIVVENII